MDLFAEIAAERRTLADQLADLSSEQRASPSLCGVWTVHDVVAHLTMPMRVSVPAMVVQVLAARGSFDRANERVTARLARSPFPELLRVLREQADARFTPPGSGPEAPLVDVLVHGLDVRWPLGLPTTTPEPRLRVALDHLASSPRGFAPRGALTGLHLRATDLDWSSGSGDAVSGPADALLLAMTDRPAALDALTGDGVPLLRSRLAGR